MKLLEEKFKRIFIVSVYSFVRPTRNGIKWMIAVRWCEKELGKLWSWKERETKIRWNKTNMEQLKVSSIRNNLMNFRIFERNNEISIVLLIFSLLGFFISLWIAGVQAWACVCVCCCKANIASVFWNFKSFPRLVSRFHSIRLDVGSMRKTEEKGFRHRTVSRGSNGPFRVLFLFVSFPVSKESHIDLTLTST